MIAGNGGSAADSDHIVGELMKSFVKRRKISGDTARKIRESGTDFPEFSEALVSKLQQGLPAINLSTHSALHTAFANDVDYGLIYAQMVLGYGKPGDVFFGITTSGNSANILEAAVVAKAIGMKTIGLTGSLGGKIKGLADVTICVPVSETFKVQELHLPVYHALCLTAEDYFFHDN